MDNAVEISVYEFLREAIDGAPTSSVLHGLELHDTIYQKIETNRGVRLSEADSDFKPSADGTFKEFDAQLTIVCFARVIGTDKTERQEAIQTVFEISVAVCELFFADESLGSRVCDSLLLRGARGFDSINAQPFAVANIPLVINPSGEYNFSRLKIAQ